MSENSLLTLLKGFKSKIKNKIPLIKTKLSKKNINVVSVLLKEGLIRGYFIKNNYFIYILLKYQDGDSITEFKSISSVKKKVYYDKICVKNSFMCYNSSILFTKKGIISHKDAVKNSLGGFHLVSFL
jgi:ribosomal protein S8